jgi:hypothetical protein
MERRRDRGHLEMALYRSAFRLRRIHDLQLFGRQLGFHRDQRASDAEQYHRHLPVFLFFEKEQEKRLAVCFFIGLSLKSLPERIGFFSGKFYLRAIARE